MIIGIGTDIVAVKRMRKLLSDTYHFKHLVFTPEEIIYCESKKDPPQHFAGRFAAKNAYKKAISADKVDLKAIPIEVTKNGRPFIKVDTLYIHLSISHNKEYALAMVIAERE